MFSSTRSVLVLSLAVLLLGPIPGCPPTPPPECVADADCRDGEFCNGQETCSAHGACVPGETPCEAGEDCNENADRCERPCVADADCTDGDPCTDDYCADGICQHDEIEACRPLPPCTTDADCNDGTFCNGAETCGADGRCQPGTDPCPGQLCRESASTCVDCLDDGDCDDETFCNGAETCDTDGRCQPATDPCPGQLCRESDDACVDCLADGDCDDGTFCNGGGTCGGDGTCQAGNHPCAANRICVEAIDRCVDCLTNADCPEGQVCEDNECVLEPPELCLTDTDCDDGEVCEQDSGDCVPAPEGGTRGLPTCYVPGESFTVRIVVNPTIETLVVGLQDFPPPGWIVTNVSHDGAWDATNEAVKWFFLDSTTRTLTYTIAVPADATGNACFDGQVNSDGGSNQDTGGPACLAPCTGG